MCVRMCVCVWVCVKAVQNLWISAEIWNEKTWVQVSIVACVTIAKLIDLNFYIYKMGMTPLYLIGLFYD